MAVSGAQKTRIGGYLSAVGKVEVFTAKSEGVEVVVPDAPHGSMSKGWSLPHYDKPEEKAAQTEAASPAIEEVIAPVKPKIKPKPKPKLKLVEYDKTLEEDRKKLLDAEIHALELAIEQDKQAAQQLAQKAEAARLLKEQHEAEELMVMLLLATV